MRNKRDGKRIVVHVDGTAGPYLMVPPEQVDEVMSELRQAQIGAARDHTGVDVDGETLEETINLGHGADINTVQSVLDAAEYGKGQAGVMGLSLNIKVRKRSWGIAIRRIDGKPDSGFAEFHRLLSQNDLKALVPGCATLTWAEQGAKVPNGFSEIVAEELPYRIALIFPMRIDADKVRAEFQQDFAE